jgi:lipoprotein-anchoring transpeptidase ErfK/SrfK
VPGIYARRYKRFEGRLYASADAYAAGEAPVGQLSREIGAKERFVAVVDSEKGPVLVRGDGLVAALDDVYLYPVSRLQGFDLEKDPLPDGVWPAFAIGYAGSPVRAAPDEKAKLVGRIPYHTALQIEATPASEDGRWWKVVSGDLRGYVEDHDGLRHPVPSPSRPAGVGDDELWVDIDVGQQVLMVFRGDRLAYFTLVSTGVATRPTPKGTYHLLQKDALKDMKSRPDSPDWYQVEDVPWAMTFKRYYMMHTAYWHWGFGRPASHGCVNLAPRDAAWLFARLPPPLPDGWATIYARSSDDPATVRVRRGDQLEGSP